MTWPTIQAVLQYLGDYGAMSVIAAIFLAGAVLSLRLLFKYLDRVLDSKFPVKHGRKSEKVAEGRPDDESSAYHPTVVAPPAQPCKHGSGYRGIPCNATWADIQDHGFFSMVQVLTNWDVATLKFSDPGRTEVFRDLLSTYLYTWDEVVRQMVKRLSTADLTNNQQFAAAHQHAVLQAVELAKQEWEDDSIPPIVVEKFLDWVNFRTTTLLEDIQLISLSRHAIAFPDRSFEVLNAFRSNLRITVYEAETVLALINGDLNGVAYKGLVIGPEPSANTTTLRAVYDRRKSEQMRVRRDGDSDSSSLAVDPASDDIRKRIAARKSTQKIHKKKDVDKPGA